MESTACHMQHFVYYSTKALSNHTIYVADVVKSRLLIINFSIEAKIFSIDLSDPLYRKHSRCLLFGLHLHLNAKQTWWKYHHCRCFSM